MKNTFVRLEADPAAGMVPSDLVAAKDFTTNDHTETIHSHFETDDERILVGV